MEEDVMSFWRRMLCPSGGGCYALLEEDVIPGKFGIIEAPLPELKNQRQEGSQGADGKCWL